MLKPHSINTMSFGEVLHIMQMLKLTAQTASFGRAQHWKVGMGMGSEIRMKSTRVAQGPWLRSRTSPPLPCFCFLGRSPTDHQINLLHRRWHGFELPNRQRGQSLKHPWNA